jgi:hypothetical protein
MDILKGRYQALTFAIVAIVLVSNVYWVAYSMPDYNSEDEILLGRSIELLTLLKNGDLGMDDIFGARGQLLIPIIFSLGLLILPHPSVPLLISMLFAIPLAWAVFGIFKKIYGERLAPLAVFFSLTAPGILMISRTLYPEYILVSLFCVAFLLYLNTDRFSKTRETLVFAAFCTILGLVKYTIVPYILVIFFYESVALIRSAFVKAKENGISLRPLLLSVDRAKFKNMALASAIILLLTLPYYSRPDVLRYFFLSSRIGGSPTYITDTTLGCEATYYPIIIFNNHLGMVLALLFVISPFINMKKHGKLAYAENMINILIASMLIIFTFLNKDKNLQVTLMLVPFMVIQVAGAISRMGKKLQLTLAIIAVITGVFYLSPFDFQRIPRIQIMNSCNTPTTLYPHSLNLQIFRKTDVSFYKEDLLLYTKRPKAMDMVSMAMPKDVAWPVRVLDLSTINNFELGIYYFLLTGGTLQIERCQDIINIRDLEQYDAYLVSDMPYSEDVCFACFETYHADECNYYREKVMGSAEHVISAEVADKAYHTLHVYLPNRIG